MENKTLTGKDILFIKKTVLVRPYNSESEGYKGKSYRIYAWGDKAFAVHEDDDFHADMQKGEVAEALISVNEEGQWSLANYTTWQKLNNLKRRQCENESITVENFKLSSVTQLEALS